MNAQALKGLAVVVGVSAVGWALFGLAFRGLLALLGGC